MFKKRFLKSKQLYIWFFSYLAIMLFCVVVSCVLHFTSVSTLREQIEKNMHFTVEQMRLFYDADFSNIQNVTYNILEERNVQSLAAGYLADSPAARTRQIKDICKNLSSAFNNSNKIKNFYIIFKNLNLTLDQKGYAPKESLFNLSFTDYYESQEDWLADLELKDTYSDYKVLKKPDGETALCYVQKTPVSGSSPAQAFAVVMLDADQMIKDRLNFSKTVEPIISILGQEGEIIFSSDEEALKPENSKKYITTAINSVFKNWQYVLMLPKSGVYGSLNRLQIVALFSYLLYLIVGAALSFYFSKKSYQPLSRLMTKFGTNPVPDEQSEFLYLEDNISQLLEKNKEIEKEFDSEMSKLRELYLSNLVLGHKEESSQNKHYRTEFSETNFNLVLFRVKDCGLLKDSTHSETDNLLSVYFLIDNVFSEVMELVGQCHFFQCEGMLACIVNSDEENPELEICAQTEFTIRFLEENFATKIVCAVSDTATSEDQLPTLYRQVKDIISLSNNTNSTPVLISKNLDETTYVYTRETEQLLITHVKHGDYLGAQNIMESIYEENLVKRELSSGLKRILFCDLAGTLFKFPAKEGENRQFFSRFIETVNTDNAEAAKATLNDYVKFLCDYVTENNRTVDNRIEQIIHFVHENYHDANLNVSYIANKFNITINYLSSYFKAKTGQVLSDYILKYRLEKASQLLSGRNCSVTDACQKCGFYDVNSFIRSFKKTYGVTPGKYGRLSAQTENE